MGGNWMGVYKPALAMVGLQFIYAGVTLFTRGALLEGLSPRVFVVYRQGIATLFFAPIALASSRCRGDSGRPPLRLKTFAWIFLASLLGVTVNQNAYFEGLYLSSSTVASSMTNLLPALTFVIAMPFGLERVDVRSVRSMAKIIGTIICVGGAISLALLKGPKQLMTTETEAELVPLPPTISIFKPAGSSDENWVLGCLLLLGSTFCWSCWMLMQVPISAGYPNHLNSSTLMCLLATLESAAVALFLEKDMESWTLDSPLKIASCLYAGIGSAASFFVQAWCISKKGPLFCAMFNPLCTVIVTAFAAVFVHEHTSLRCLIGATGVIVGLYAVLWGKVEDIQGITRPPDHEKKDEPIHKFTEQITCHTVDLEEPLLLEKPLVSN